ncbi:MAG: hypothetical protein KJ670_12690 [Alphaproteobacteria bacterium]|nr:hypothetical protein [Alphaproteobacteria bacterium]MBU4050777.1 hypothetical protein [Alphaproteobacteria bacterium]MBU4089566.1 hypothetical protein [Alphaproteobacteria bacterium]MBU4155498.1 hypothetical protein [Alphaproteobacteria bacterium]
MADYKPKPNAGQDPDDAPDLSQTPWREKLGAAVARVGPEERSGAPDRAER